MSILRLLHLALSHIFISKLAGSHSPDIGDCLELSPNWVFLTFIFQSYTMATQVFSRHNKNVPFSLFSDLLFMSLCFFLCPIVYVGIYPLQCPRFQSSYRIQQLLKEWNRSSWNVKAILDLSTGLFICLQEDADLKTTLNSCSDVHILNILSY